MCTAGLCIPFHFVKAKLYYEMFNMRYYRNLFIPLVSNSCEAKYVNRFNLFWVRLARLISFLLQGEELKAFKTTLHWKRTWLKFDLVYFINEIYFKLVQQRCKCALSDPHWSSDSEHTYIYT